MRRLTLLLPLLLLAFQPALSQKLTILHTNDLHSRLWGFGPENDYTPLTINDDNTIGGFSRIATILSDYRNKGPESTLVLDIGDFLMGTIYQTAEARTGFQLRLMHKMGYDLVSLGNHEFDFGNEQLARIIKKSAEQPIPGILLSNISFNPADPGDDSIEALVTSGVITPYRTLVRNGLKIGFFALMGINAADVAPGMKPIQVTDRIIAARQYAKLLREQEKVDVVICLSHCGLVFDPELGWTGEDPDLARQVPEIDVILSGHTHTKLVKPLIINNIPIVQSGSEGRFIGVLEIEKTPQGVKVNSGELIPVDDRIPGDPGVQRMVEEYQEQISKDLFAEYGFSAEKPLVETAFGLRFDSYENLETSNLGPFLADALYYYARTIDPNPTDVVMVNAGLVRDEILPGKTGRQLPADLFRSLPLGISDIDGTPGYSMCKCYVTGRELKNIVEAMLIAQHQSTDYYPYWSGIRFKTNSLRMPLDKVYQIELGNDRDGYRKISLSKDPGKLYGLVTNNYVMKFFGVIKSSTKGLLSVVPKLADGTPVTDFNLTRIDRDPGKPGVQEAKEWAGIMVYAASLPDTNGNGLGDMPEKYRTVPATSETGRFVNPVKLFGGSNGITLVPTALLVAILAGTALIVF